VFPLRLKKLLRPGPTCLAPGACPGRWDGVCDVNTCHGFYAATTDPSVVVNWFTAHPLWKLGLPTGAMSGLVALDVVLLRRPPAG